MPYITAETATRIIEGEGNSAGWTALDDAGKLALLEKASNRLELLGFENDKDSLADGGYYQRPRYVNGFKIKPNDVAAELEYPIEKPLEIAVALLARYYVDFPNAQNRISEDNYDSALSKHLADMPLSVQNAVWQFLSNEYKVNEFESEDLPLEDTRKATGISYSDGSERPFIEVPERRFFFDELELLHRIRKLFTFTLNGVIPPDSWGGLTAAQQTITVEPGLPPGFRIADDKDNVYIPVYPLDGTNILIHVCKLNNVEIQQAFSFWCNDFGGAWFCVRNDPVAYLRARAGVSTVESLWYGISNQNYETPAGVEIELWAGTMGQVRQR